MMETADATHLRWFKWADHVDPHEMLKKVHGGTIKYDTLSRLILDGLLVAVARKRGAHVGISKESFHCLETP